jgi:hypothetical protein
MISSLLGPRGSAVLVDVFAYLMLFSFVWALVKVSFERAVGKPMPRTVVTLALDVIADLANNLPGALNRASGGGLFVSPKAAEIERLRARLAELAADRLEPPAPPGTRPTSLPPVGMVLLFVAVMLGCASRQPGDPGMATAKIVLATTAEVRNGLCDRSLFGAPPPLDVDNAPRDLAGVVGQVRAWLCADALGSLLDLARELATPRPSPAAESDAGPTAATDASTGDASPGAPDDTEAPPTAETSDVDAGEVSP